MRIAEAHKQLSNLFWRIVPIGTLVLFFSYILGTQVVAPQRRVMKVLVMVLVAVIMWRFEIILTLYIFVVLFPLPSGVAITSTNVALMTLIFLFWVIRANARRIRILPKTPLDKLIILFIGAYIVSFFNVGTGEGIVEGLKIVWRQLSAIAFFYLIVLSVDDEAKMEMFTKVVAVSAGLIAFTAVIELVSPGTTIVPGWIQLDKRLGEGTLGYRLEGLRLHGAVGSHSLLSDYSTFALFFMGLHFVRARNIVARMLWLLTGGMTFVIIMATANRGAFISLMFGVIYALWVFRWRMNLVRYAVAISALLTLFAAAQLIIQHHAYAVSVIDRLMHTKLIGGVPESREGLYPVILEHCMNHIFIGHGPHYKLGAGLEKLYWPHNGYLYFLFTLGMFGLGTFLAICYRLIRMSLICAKKSVRDTRLGMLMGVLHVQLAVLLLAQMRTDHQRDGDYVYIYIVWMLFGLVAATHRLISNGATGAEESEDTSEHRAPALGHEA